jgi:glycosyltransferase involved in cell wall biosynthesis
LPEEEEMDGIRLVRTWFPSRTPAGWTLHALASVPATRRLAATAEVIHAQAFASILPCRMARRRGQAFVSTLHTSHFLRLAARPWVRPGLRALVAMPDHNFASSIEIANVGMGLGRGLEVEALANGVDTAFFRPVPPSLDRDGEGIRLVAPRRLFAKNGVEYLVRAMPLILAEAPADLILIGDGPERGRLEALCRELGVSDHVSFLGARPHHEMPGLLCSADLAVFPSLMEATSVGALEAMACELPVAASNVGGLPEIVDGEVGRLFPPADPAGLAGAVVALIREGDLGKKGQRARSRVVAQWSNDRLVDRHLEVYRELMARTTAQGGHVQE